ncbi:uncharacterized protein F5147DRAFT_680447 [Suillus discolor]|uniref:Uncharacterized protein n=1 Tax=Suillus discolor TaxID=1912936 RepID=A0A9P7FDS2_9AGAM|nr:uncharacterized protein F5147DRAFT_680447 [Suillus discolor]KAG2113897.1 hypothetical protein F5147DRAFT_680447 [Suillus discolor]
MGSRPSVFHNLVLCSALRLGSPVRLVAHHTPETASGIPFGPRQVNVMKPSKHTIRTIDESAKASCLHWSNALRK